MPTKKTKTPAADSRAVSKSAPKTVSRVKKAAGGVLPSRKVSVRSAKTVKKLPVKISGTQKSEKNEKSEVREKKGGAKVWLKVKRASDKEKHDTNRESGVAGKEKKEPQKLTLVYAADDAAFWVNDGPILKNLRDLHDALGAISDDQYAYHAEGESNDFAKWVEEVLCDGDCAQALAEAKTRDHAQKAVAARLRIYVM
ncbi:MAG TPA: hypothetical protein VFM02_02335 [Candidatus Paceibacterota bacterium]|nr:hypothetical protein [Candidatus Paceibacterota bacterium]